MLITPTQLTDIHAVPSQRAEPGLQLLLDVQDVRLKERLQGLWHLLAHVTVIRQHQLQVSAVLLEAALLLQYGLG